jgi:para-aminobenzoate synthetase component 1
LEQPENGMPHTTFAISNIDRVKKQLLIWGSRFSSCCFLDNHHYEGTLQQVECMMAAGVLHAVQASAGNALEQLRSFQKAHPNQWIFGHLAYDLKQETENVPSTHPDETGFPDLYFFIPETVVQLRGDSLTITTHEENSEPIFKEILSIDITGQNTWNIATIEARISKEQYLQTIHALHAHILRGDCYEINYCQEFFAKDVDIEPASLYEQLGNISPNPFACYYRVNDSHLLCASPERFLMKKGSKLLSQPIKGTSPRYPENAALDNQSRQHLQTNAKERSENVMVVDLVRNDLSRISKEGTVHVDELFGVYSYPHVHQMISTISGIVKDDLDVADIIKASFPMGSMTGAPKKSVVELIEKYEPFRRGLFSGSVGYISPEGDFDFNVVIRSIFYNAENRRLSFMAGSGITWYSNAEKEYEECLLKAKAIMGILQS